MKKFPLLICVGIVVAGLIVMNSSNTALAHVLRQDNGISAELHIPPNDHPIANQLTQFELSFGDDKNTFSLPDCNCQLQIKHNGQLLQSLELKPALQGATLNAMVMARFSAAGVYDVVVSGQPKDNAFQLFQLTYPVRVMGSVVVRPVHANKSRGAVIVIAVCVVAMLGLFGYAASQNWRRRSR